VSAAHLLLEPIQVGAISLPNRIVMAPMTRSRSGPRGVPTPLNETYYSQRASAGLIVAEATQISADAQGYLRTPGIHTPEQIAAWRVVTESVHRSGGRMVLQLWHVGRISHPENRQPGSRSVSPSAVAAQVRIFTANGMQLTPMPHALTITEVRATVRGYAQAARNAMEAGFDGVEIHAANGYLVDQFLHSNSNLRSDVYGGSAVNRSRFLWEVCEAAMDAIGPGRVGIRLSPFGEFNTVQDRDPARLFATAIRGLEAIGPAYLHVINPEAAATGSASNAALPSLDVPRFCRDHFRGTLIVAGGYSQGSAERALRDGEADLIGFGRPFISNPDLVERFRAGAAVAAADRATFYTEGPQGYTDYPTLGCRASTRS
jgi:N-ethylmaleimide reductase